MDERNGHPERARYQDDKLDQVGPQHRCETSHDRIERSHAAHEENGDPLRKTRRDGQGDGRRIDNGAHPAETSQHEERRHGIAGARSETRTDILIRGGGAHASVDGIEHGDKNRQNEWTDHTSGQQRQVAVVRDGGHAHERNGTRDTGKHAHGHRQPRHIATG